MTSLALPVEVDDLRARWFSDALQREVTQATVIDRSTGTTGRARVALLGEPGVPASVFVKLPPFGEQQRALVDRTGMGVTEARFYRDLARELPVRVPEVLFAATDGHEYVMVLEDLVATGCRFPSPEDPDIAARARDIVEQLAALHAPFWESPRFATGGDLDWLAARGARGGGGGRAFIQQAVEVLGDTMDDAFNRIADLYLARTDDIVRLWREGPGTLVHGDSHIGNLFVDTANRQTGRASSTGRSSARHPGYATSRTRCATPSRRTYVRRSSATSSAVTASSSPPTASRSTRRTRGISTACTRCTRGSRRPRLPPWARSGSRSRSASRPPDGRPRRAHTSTAWDCWNRCSREQLGGCHRCGQRAEGLRAFSFGDSGPKIHRFRDVPWEFADAEGEGFRSIEHWRDGHQSYYAKRAIAVDDTTAFVCVWFRVLEMRMQP